MWILEFRITIKIKPSALGVDVVVSSDNKDVRTTILAHVAKLTLSRPGRRTFCPTAQN